MTAAAETERDIPGTAMPVHPLREFWYYFSENTGAVIGLVTVVTIVLIAFSADLIAPHSPIEQYREHFLLPPAWLEGGNWSFPLGTDAVGRDILSRLMHGSRYSLFVGVIVLTLSLSIGVTLGLVAAYFRGPVEIVIMRMIMLVPVQRQRPAGPDAKQGPILRRFQNHLRRAFATHMPIKTNNAIRSAHHHVQIMADQNHATSNLLANFLDKPVKGGDTWLIQPLRGLVQ